MSLRFGHTVVLAGLLNIGSALAENGDTPPSAPRLVLQITVDGLRGDLLRRYGDR